MLVNHLINRFSTHLSKDFMVWNANNYTYANLQELIDLSCDNLRARGISAGHVVLLEADYSPLTVATLIALIKRKCIVGLVGYKNGGKIVDFAQIAEANFTIKVKRDETLDIIRTQHATSHTLLQQLQNKSRPGLIIFSSGSTGKPKATVHDFNLLFNPLLSSKKQTRVIAFLLFDHIGGMNTLFYTLFNGGCLITVNERTPIKVASAIDEYKAEALTTTPSFLNLLLLVDTSRYNFSSLRYINYSSEVMPETTLRRLQKRFPSTRLSQTYGSSEMGVLPVRSEASNSLFISIEGGAAQYRIIDGKLEIKSKTSMLGYLNAPTPFTFDGWYKTGDMVEMKDGKIRIIGRASEIINVGGEKVFPAEIENVIQQIPGVCDVVVFGEKNSFLGEIVAATITVDVLSDKNLFKRQVNIFCQKYLSAYQIPQKIILSQKTLYNERFKKVRQPLGEIA